MLPPKLFFSSTLAIKGKEIYGEKSVWDFNSAFCHTTYLLGDKETFINILQSTFFKNNQLSSGQ